MKSGPLKLLMTLRRNDSSSGSTCTMEPKFTYSELATRCAKVSLFTSFALQSSAEKGLKQKFKTIKISSGLFRIFIFGLFTSPVSTNKCRVVFYRRVISGSGAEASLSVFFRNLFTPNWPLRKQTQDATVNPNISHLFQHGLNELKPDCG